MEPLLNTKALAAYLNKSESTIRFWRHKKIGPRGIRVGREVMYRESDVRAWIDQQDAEQNGVTA